MVSVEELRKTAALAALSLEGADIDALLSDLNNVIEFAGMIAEAQVSAESEDRETEACDLRDDTVTPSFDRTLLLSNAYESDGRYFIVKKPEARR